MADNANERLQTLLERVLKDADEEYNYHMSRYWHHKAQERKYRRQAKMWLIVAGLAVLCSLVMGLQRVWGG